MKSTGVRLRFLTNKGQLLTDKSLTYKQIYFTLENICLISYINIFFYTCIREGEVGGLLRAFVFPLSAPQAKGWRGFSISYYIWNNCTYGALIPF